MTSEVFFHNFSRSQGMEEAVKKQISSVVRKNLRHEDQADWKVHLSTERVSDGGARTEFIVEVLLRAPRLPTIIIKKSASNFDRALAAATAACAHALQKIKGRSRSYVPRTRNRERRRQHFDIGAMPQVGSHLTANASIPSLA